MGRIGRGAENKNNAKEVERLNLYKVMPGTYDWCCFVFAETRNKAKAMLVGYYDDKHAYTDFRCKTIKKETGGVPEICDMDCERLAGIGIWYSKYDDSY